MKCCGLPSLMLTEVLDKTTGSEDFSQAWASWWRLHLSRHAGEKPGFGSKSCWSCVVLVLRSLWFWSLGLCGSGPQVLPVWGLAIPLPAVLMITVGLYMMVLGVGLWIRYCLKVGSAGLVPGEELCLVVWSCAGRMNKTFIYKSDVNNNID